MYKISPSLYNSWRYYTQGDFSVYENPDAAEHKAKQEFLDYLNRVEKPATETMQRGIDFENLVMDLATDKLSPADAPDNGELGTAQEISDLLRYGFWQQHIERQLTPDVILHGYADVILRDTIHDIKRVSQYDVGKYSDSIQHLVYMFCAELPKFDYDVSDGRSVYVESYAWGPDSEKNLCGKVLEMIRWLESAPPEFSEPFKKNFTI